MVMPLHRAQDFEEKYVHQAYDSLAKVQQAESCSKKWSQVERFLQSLPSGALVCDIGCGRGHYLDVSFSENVVVGVERSAALCELIRSHGQEVARCDIGSIPYRSGCLDGVVCSAVIHHLATKQRRLTAIREISRVLRKKGRAFISAWAMDSSHSQFEGHDVLVPIKLKGVLGKSAEEKLEDVAERDEKHSDYHRHQPRFIWHQPTNESYVINTGLVTQELHRTNDKYKDQNIHHFGDRAESQISLSSPTEASEATFTKTTIVGRLREYITNSPVHRGKHTTVKKWRNGDQHHNGARSVYRNDAPAIETQKRSTEHEYGVAGQVQHKHLGELRSQKGTEIQKYYHIFTEKEFYELVSMLSDLVIVDRCHDNRNWVCIVEKV